MPTGPAPASKSAAPARLKAARALLAVMLALGLFFRVAYLDRKVYWHDEVYTSLRVTGHIGEEADAALFTGELLDRADLLRYQRLSPERGWGDTLYSLTTHPEHPPLYYLLLRGWLDCFGSSVAAARSLSVVFSLLSFPALYWLCRELFEERVWPVAFALWSVSPVHVLYAQEARPYSLWTLLTLLSTAALLRATRFETSSHKAHAHGANSQWRRWLLYSLTLTLSAYTSLISGVVWLCHGLYLLVMALQSRGHDLWQSLWRWLLATALAGLLFAPWLSVLVVNWNRFQAKTSWVKFSAPLSLLSRLWGLHFSSAFIDLGLPLEHPYTYIAPAVTLLLVGWALVTLCRRRSRRVWLLLFLLVVPPVVLIAPDVLTGGQRSLNTRYFLPALTTAQVAVAYLMTWLTRPAALPPWRGLGRGLLALVLTAGVVSCTLSASADAWWNKMFNAHNSLVPAALRPLNRPIVVSGKTELTLGSILSLAHEVDDSVQFQLFVTDALPAAEAFEVPDDDRDRVLFSPTGELIDAFAAAGFTVEGFEQDNVPLLRLVKHSEPKR